MRFSPLFFKVVAVCAVLSSVTTLTNILLPWFYVAPVNFEQQIALSQNSLYLTRQWVMFAHAILTLIAAWGVVAVKLDDAAGLVSTGFLFAFIEKITELYMHTLTIFVLNYNWRTRFGQETDEAVRTALKTNITGFLDIWNDLFFLLWVCFFIERTAFRAGDVARQRIGKMGEHLLFGERRLNVADDFGRLR